MYRSVIIPLDGSRLSEAILPYARAIAQAFHCPVDLLQVIEPETIETLGDPGRGSFLDVVEADLRRSTKDYLNTVRASFDTGSSVDCHIEVGNPAEVIMKRAEQASEALIAMSTHGRSGLQRWYVGSVADKVLRTSKNPMLIVKGGEQVESSEETATACIERLLLCLDQSPLAELAVPHAVALAEALGARLDLMCVYTALTRAEPGEGFLPNYETMTATLRHEARGYLEKQASTLEHMGLGQVNCIVQEGDAAAEIIDVAHKMEENLVVMSSHGRSGIGRWVLGGTTDRVVRYSKDPVLVIRAPE